MPPCENCGHEHVSHRYGGANRHGPYTYLSSCRRCGCDQFETEAGTRRDDYLFG